MDEDVIHHSLRKITQSDGLTGDALLHERVLLELPWLAEEAALLQLPKLDVLHAWVREVVLELTSPPRKRVDLAIQAAMGLLPSITSASELGERQLDLAARLKKDSRTIHRWTEEGLGLVARRLLDRPDRARLQRAVSQAQAGAAVRFRLPFYETTLFFDRNGHVARERQRYELVALQDGVRDLQLGHAYEDLEGVVHHGRIKSVLGAEVVAADKQHTGVMLWTFRLPRETVA